MDTCSSYCVDDDSDATTVAADEEKRQGLSGEEDREKVEELSCQVTELSDSSMPCSPSILHPNEATNTQEENKDLVPCSSEEEETLSQEYPPLLPPSIPMVVAAAAPSTGDAEAAVKQQPQSNTSLLSQIELEQAHLLSEMEKILGNYGNIFPVAFVKDARAKLPELEKKLKLVSENHQAERKELVATHAQLSQGRGCSSQESGGEGPSNETESLRAKLISLSARQKQLLRCFTNQKEITSKAAKLAEREVKARKTITVEPLNQKSHPVQVTLPNLLKHLQSVLLPPGAPPPSNVQPHPLPPSQLHPPQLHAETASLSQTVSSVPQPRVAEQLNDASALGRPRVGHAQSSQDVVPPAAPGRRQPSVALAQDIRSRQEGETRGSLSSSQLMQPVPLDMLIQHNILEPGPQTLTCTILGCDFVASLARDGSIEEAQSPGSSVKDTIRHGLPQQWVKSCWALLGHPHKKISKKQAYNMILFRGKTLSRHCELYSRKQVSTFLSHKKTTLDMNTDSWRTETTGSAQSLPAATKTMNNSTTHSNSQAVVASTQPTQCPSGGIDFSSLLISGEVVLVSNDFKTLQLPSLIRDSFWECNESAMTPKLLKELENNLEW